MTKRTILQWIDDELFDEEQGIGLMLLTYFIIISLSILAIIIF